MGNSFSTRPRRAADDDAEDYLFIDARAVILDRADEPPAMSRPQRPGLPTPGKAARCEPESEWREFLASSRCAAPGPDAETLSLWQRVARRLRHVWPGTRRPESGQ